MTETMTQDHNTPPAAGAARLTRRRAVGLALAAGLGGLLLAACGGSTTATTAPRATTAPTIAATQAATRAATAAVGGTARASGTATSAAKVNANTASVAELTAAFQAAGISNAARWAREVEEYRPYPTNDPNFAKLRSELAKYNPGPGVVDQIVATLSLQ